MGLGTTLSNVMYRSLLKPFFFGLDAERAHLLALRLAGSPLGRLVPGQDASQYPALATQAFGLSFPNPLGLAAGLDKDARLLPFWQRLGFGFVEVGTVTPRPQVGNPRPRLFRLPKDQALLNRMGFNNEGVEAMAKRLEQRPQGLIVGANIGKNKDTPNEEAVQDYVRCFSRLQALADYFVVNVSSPNTPGLRQLQGREALVQILGSLQALNKLGKPILLKIAPDLTEEQLQEIGEVVRDTGTAGLIAGNTTLSRAGLHTAASQVEALGAGGLSGAPLCARAQQIAEHLAPQQVPFVGVGGILDGPTAHARLQAGASLIQVYTGFIYAGPGLVPQILAYLNARLHGPKS
jgi:dihydroorotate dehydrogenase